MSTQQSCLLNHEIEYTFKTLENFLKRIEENNNKLNNTIQHTVFLDKRLFQKSESIQQCYQILKIIARNRKFFSQYHSVIINPFIHYISCLQDAFKIHLTRNSPHKSYCYIFLFSIDYYLVNLESKEIEELNNNKNKKEKKNKRENIIELYARLSTRLMVSKKKVALSTEEKDKKKEDKNQLTILSTHELNTNLLPAPGYHFVDKSQVVHCVMKDFHIVEKIYWYNLCSNNAVNMIESLSEESYLSTWMNHHLSEFESYQSTLNTLKSKITEKVGEKRKRKTKMQSNREKENEKEFLTQRTENCIDFNEFNALGSKTIKKF